MVTVRALISGSSAKGRHGVAGPSARRGLPVLDPDDPSPLPTRYERQRARNLRRVIYAVIYSVAGITTLGNLLFWCLING